MSTLTRRISAPRGPAITGNGWPQEAALRMLMNDRDPEVAERPDDLVAYGGSGRAARSWRAFDAIVAALRRLQNDETLVIQSGEPVAIVRHADAGYPEAVALAGRAHIDIPAGMPEGGIQ